MNPNLFWLQRLMLQQKQMQARLHPGIANPYFRAFTGPAESGVGMSSGNMKTGGSSAG